MTQEARHAVVLTVTDTTVPVYVTAVETVTEAVNQVISQYGLESLSSLEDVWEVDRRLQDLRDTVRRVIAMVAPCEHESVQDEIREPRDEKRYCKCWKNRQDVCEQCQQRICLNCGTIAE